MTRPDSRLLVRADALPVVPVGALVWHGNLGGAFTVIRHAQRGLLLCDSEPDGGTRDVRWFDMSPTLLIDLSAPEQRNGLDVRLDALPWTLRALHPEAMTSSLFDTVAGLRSATLADAWGASARSADGRVVLWIVRESFEWLAGTPIVLGSAWPDLTNLSPADAARAVVCAALHARSNP